MLAFCLLPNGCHNVLTGMQMLPGCCTWPQTACMVCRGASHLGPSSETDLSIRQMTIILTVIISDNTPGPLCSAL